MKTKTKMVRVGMAIGLTLSLVLFVGPTSGLAADVTWTNLTGVDNEWNTAGNWLPATVPGTSDNAFLTNQTATYMVNYNQAMVAASISNLTISTASDKTTTLNINTNGFKASSATVKLGGVLNINTGGVVTTTNGMAVGYGSGVVNINGGVLSNANIGVTVGPTSTDKGTLTLNAGSWFVPLKTVLVYGNDSALNIYGGDARLRQIIVGQYFGTATMTMTNGSLTVVYVDSNTGILIGYEGVPYVGKGIFNLSGGTVTNQGYMQIGGQNGPSRGELNISGGSWVQKGVTLLGNYLSGNATGTLSIVGGTFSTTNRVTLGVFSGCGGILTNGGGSVYVTNAAANATLNVCNGALRMTTGFLTVDKLLATNGVNSVIAFAGGTLNTKATVVSNGSAFVAGDGVRSAMLNLVAGTNAFADGLAINTNATLTIGGTNVIGSTRIEGNLALRQNARLDWDYNATTQDWAVVTGTVTLASSVSVNLTSIGLSTPRTIPLLTAAGGFVGDPSGWPLSSVAGQRYYAQLSGNTLLMVRVPRGTVVKLQ